MRRRTFCAAALAALATATFPYRRALRASSGELGAIGLDGRQLTLSAADIADLRAALRGELLTAGDAGYDDARRLWNAAFNRKPALTGGNYPRLVALKKRYDPGNLFRLNANIKPA